jgi:hypothetical protein
MSTHPIDTTALSLAIEAALQGAARRLAAHDHQMIARVATVAYVVCWRRPKTEPLLRVVPTQN